jgi:hypothetical protein
VTTGEVWTFGVEPLPDQLRLADAVREVIAMSLQLEQTCPELGELVIAVEAAREALRTRVREDRLPRVGERQDGRAYIDHAFDPGAFNPMFPRYEISVASETFASGTVSFPVCYEGGPGIVHGGFLAVFIDAAVQHHNCHIGISGKTRSLEIRYRRPVPLVTPLRFEIDRDADAESITSALRLFHGEELLCAASTPAVASDPAKRLYISPRR